MKQNEVIDVDVDVEPDRNQVLSESALSFVPAAEWLLHLISWAGRMVKINSLLHYTALCSTQTTLRRYL